MTTDNHLKDEKTPAPKKRSEKRKRNRKIDIRVTDEEYETILNNAKDCGLPVPSLLRQVGLGLRLKSVADQRVFLELMRMHKDLNRLGGLIKLWLSERETKLPSEGGISVRDLHNILNDVRVTSDEMKKTAGKLLD